ncbi:MAG: hypothetical protein EBR09_03865 [Proteobacteria bacterium]|nr:hypothetical protein [Pseudomonadota bacterium]
MKQNQFSRFFVLAAAAALAGTTLTSCGSISQQVSSAVQSTDQRPDISEDRTSVHITAGTKDFAHIYAKDLQALVTNVPDPDTGRTSTQKLTGTWIFDVAQNPRTHIVAVGVRSFIFAETDFSMLFLVNPAFPDKPQLVSFVMPDKKSLAANTTHALRSIRGLRFDDSGILHVTHSDASGSRAEVLVNPDGSIRGCKYIEKDEGQLCGEDH